MSDVDSIRTKYALSEVSLGVAALALGGAAVLLFTRSSHRSTAHFDPWRHF
jgi:hypothetical protein